MLKQLLFANSRPETGYARIRDLLRFLAQAYRPMSDRELVATSSLFDPDHYRAHNPEVRGVDPVDHYLAHGWREGRAPGPCFDSAWYVAAYPDVAAAEIDPFLHYLRHGFAEGRLPRPEPDEDDDRTLVERSGLLDADWYRGRHADAAGDDPLDHYLAGAWSDGRSPGPDFDARHYLATYRDVADARLNPLLHYLRYGRREGRCARPHRLTGRESGLVERAIAEFAALDPLGVPGLCAPDTITVAALDPACSATKTWDLLFERLEADYDVLAFVPSLPPGGLGPIRHAPDTQGLNLARVAVVATDTPSLARDRGHPGGLLALGFDHDGHVLGPAERVSLVESLIFAVQPASVVNLGSLACWEVFSRRGRALMRETALFAADLSHCPAGDRDDRAGARLRDCLPVLSRAYFDDDARRRRWLERANVPPSFSRKVEVLDRRACP